LEAADFFAGLAAVVAFGPSVLTFLFGMTLELLLMMVGCGHWL
jgi:hypothetical protein